MSKLRYTSLKQLLRQILFLCLPSILMIYILIHAVSEYIPVLNYNQHIFQTIYFAAGILISCIFYSFRFKFLPSSIILLLLLEIISAGLDNFALGEFDSFFLSIDFMLFRTLFLSGYVCGWGFSRSKYFPAILSTVLLITGVMVTALSGEITFKFLLKNFAPVPVFAFYIIFMNELLRNTDEKELRSWIKPVRGLVIYSVAMCLLLFLTFKVFNKDIKTLEVKWEEGISDDSGKSSLYKILPDSSVQMKQSIQINDNLNREQNGENIALFVAYVDNFFPETEIPNPLYFVSEYLPLFDDYTETFEADSAMPKNDLFSPDPSAIPLYFTASDESVIENGMSQKYRKIVEAEVYKIKISPMEFTAPSTAFYCQPIAVKNDLKNKYNSAYRAKMWVSELNSAYFVYNNISHDFDMQLFQEQRFDILRKVADFKNVDTAFVNYYTKYPQNKVYDTVRKISETIINEAKAKTPIDKILAIRDYFMQQDEFGLPLFKYSDVATTVPPGSRILNFLLNEHVGNCTYYAGSTLLMLRAAGIPARIATGYAVVDRSSNNKGWYWIYSKQAHAWVQVFFPEYGWLDFDTTFGDSEQSEAPQTDGTPPLDPQKAWFAATGEVLKVDTIKEIVRFNVGKLVYFDKEYQLESAADLQLDISLAALYKDSAKIKIEDIVKGDKGLALSFTQPENLVQQENSTIEHILRNLPQPVPIDEFRLENKHKEKQKTVEQIINRLQSKHSIVFIVVMCAVVLIILLIVTLSIPYIIFLIYSRRAKSISDPGAEAYYSYRAATFLLYQMGYFRKDLTPLQYAGQLVDPELGTSFEAFTATYLKVKYARQTLTNEDSQRILTFYLPFEQAVMSKISFRKRFLHFLNIYNTLEFFTKPK
ncbi:MAG: transglutaminase domain-containing protein [Prevotellaceae bacterium]|jgi:hypothetical protein|nr:transglutaminase domain-containing protein [Prevotellaceae bacterium]